MRIESRPKLNTDFQQSHPLHQRSILNYLPLAVITLLILNLLATCTNTSTLRSAISNRSKIYVQSVDGTTLEAQLVDPLHRSDATIRNFAEDWLKLAYTWKASTEEATNFVKERGIAFPREFHVASIALEPAYREAFMDRQTQKYQKEFAFGNYITGRSQAYVRVFEPGRSKVQLVEKGVWDVTIVATRTHAIDNSIFAQETLNRIIRVKAISPEINQKLWEQETYLGKVMNEMQQQGLQIVQVSEF